MFTIHGKKGKKGANATLPASSAGSSAEVRTAGASGSSSLPLLTNTEKPTPTKKRERSNSQDSESNPEKKQDGRTSPGTAAPVPTPANDELVIDGHDSISSAGNSEEELDNLTDDEITRSIHKVSLDDNEESYSGAAKKPRLNIPDLVYIQKGLERREPISQVHYNAFMEHLLGKITDLSFKDCANLHIAWHGWGLGRGIVACLNPEAASYVKEVAKGFSLNGLNFRAWSKHEFGRRDIYSGHLPGICWQKRKKVDTIRWILNVNGLNGLGFQLISYINTPNGVVFRLEASKELSMELSKRKYLNAGIARVELKVLHLGPEVNKSSSTTDIIKVEDKTQTAEKQS